MAYAKLDESFATSSLLATGGLELAGLWAVLLVLCDSTGRVTESLPMLSKRCSVSRKRLRHLLDLLEGPDPDSRTPDHQGRRIRIESQPWGIALLNYQQYREKDHTNADRQRRFRARRNGVTPLRNGEALRVTHADADVEADATDIPTPAAHAHGGTVHPNGHRLPDQIIAEYRQRHEAKLVQLVEQIARKTGTDQATVMVTVTAYEANGREVPGRTEPADLSDGRLELSIADAMSWLSALSAQPAAGGAR